MLVLYRKYNEKIVIVDRRTGKEIAVVTVAKIGETNIRLGVDAPREIKIMRSELIKDKPK